MNEAHQMVSPSSSGAACKSTAESLNGGRVMVADWEKRVGWVGGED